MSPPPAPPIIVPSKSFVSEWTSQAITPTAPTINLGTPVCDIYEYGSPIYLTNPGDPSYSVKVLRSGWGPALGGLTVPVPAGAVGSHGSDRWINIVDPINRVNYSMWRFTPPAAGSTEVVCAYGTVEDLDGSATRSMAGSWTGGGAGISMLALVVLMSELAAGVIPHPMKFGCPATSPAWVLPATKSDGQTAGGIPQGTLIQMDPTIDLAAIVGITPFELMIGVCLQSYGAYCVDTAGGFAFVFETPTVQSPVDWYKVNNVYDYQRLPHLPWDALRVIPVAIPLVPPVVAI